MNRYLALFLFFEGVLFLAGDLGIFFDELAVLRGLTGLLLMTFGVQPWLYLLFMGQALQTPLVRPFRGRWGQGVLLAAAVLLTGIFIATQDSVQRPGALGWFLLGSVVAVSFYGIVAAASSLRRSGRGTAARTRSKTYLMAFVSRDVGWIMLGTTFGLVFTVPELDFLYPVLLMAALLGELCFVVFLNYGIFRFHLFNLDYGIRWTISRGTVAAILVAGFFVVTSIASNWFEQWGWALGGLATGLLLFLIHPLLRIGERLAGAAVPNSKPLSQMNVRERVDIYRKQLEVAWEDGTLSTKERRMLEVSRGRLGISDQDAHRVEREVVGS